ncbi:MULTISPECIES: tyrosine-type recombinase/integrase [Mumia]|uniref:tyrosine-type recombinase/integrase n=1 Tax=Mumia TaxID=1546255 RepID=UPI001422EDDF|nr:tyrosine-type recombinase/integrase [Mumia sp. ZJ1417]QMW66729.1 tyrosine-type recombinase/integrase [Mumia sp. ZJ1417]
MAAGSSWARDYRAFQLLLKRAGLRRIRLHDLRHTAASLMLEHGVPARVVMELLGHLLGSDNDE